MSEEPQRDDEEQSKVRELDDDELDQVAGGTGAEESLPRIG